MNAAPISNPGSTAPNQTAAPPTQRPNPFLPIVLHFVKLLPTGISVLVSGLGIGIMIGLSVTPVVNSVVASLVALVVGLLTLSQDARLGWTRNGVNGEVWFSINTPIALASGIFVFGLVAGSLTGMYWRTHNTFGVNALPPGIAPVRPSGIQLIPVVQKGQLGVEVNDEKQEQPSKQPAVSAGQGVLFGHTTSRGCTTESGALSDERLKSLLAQQFPGLATALAPSRSTVKHDDLVKLYNALVCSTVPLSKEELAEIQSKPDRSVGKTHTNPVLAHLSENLSDQKLWEAVLEHVFGPQ